MPYTDIFLYDVKAFDKDVHIKCTGQSNELILKNLKYIDSCNKSIEIRIPYVPDYNPDQIEKIAEFLKPLKNIKDVKVLPYHNYAGSKYVALGMENTLPQILLIHLYSFYYLLFFLISFAEILVIFVPVFLFSTTSAS